MSPAERVGKNAVIRFRCMMFFASLRHNLGFQQSLYLLKRAALETQRPKSHESSIRQAKALPRHLWSRVCSSLGAENV
jgi:hypothetical protein